MPKLFKNVFKNNLKKSEAFSIPWNKALKARLTILVIITSLITGLLIILFLIQVFQRLNALDLVLPEVRRDFFLLAVIIILALLASFLTNLFLIKKNAEKKIEKQRLSNKAVHDLKNQLYAIISRLNSGEVEYAFEKLNELCSDFGNAISVSNTGNEALDTLINSKYQEINENGIEFSIKCFTVAENKIEDLDLCVLIGNALDNAIEACERMEKGSLKYIKLTILQIETNLSIQLVNSSAGEDSGLNHEFVTMKKEKYLHGFGLKRMQEIVNKYEGYIEYYLKNGEFHLKILIPNSIALGDP